MLYLKSIEIENVRCFTKKQPIKFTDSSGKISQWTVILGDNGTGKTCILRSIVSVLPTPQRFLSKRNPSETEFDLSLYDDLRGYWDLRNKNGEFESKLSLTVAEYEKPFENEEFKTELTCTVDHSKSFSDNYNSQTSKFDTKVLSPVFCFAYGANRKMAVSSLSESIFTNSCETLFKDDALLQNSTEYFLRMDYETAKSRKGSEGIRKVKELLLKVLPSGVKDIEVVKTGKFEREVQVETAYGWVNLNELSLGYKTTIAWLIDFANKMIYYHDGSANPFEEPAILILDEIDLHMHPSWQREIIENLTRIFPKTQFIVTAHSPLIVQAALNTNLVLLKKTGDHVKVINEPDIVRSWRIDQVLTSDLFGLKGSRPKEVEEILKRRRSLLRKTHLTPNEQSELEKLNQEVDLMPYGETENENRALDVLRDFAKKLDTTKKGSQDDKNK